MQQPPGAGVPPLVKGITARAGTPLRTSRSGRTAERSMRAVGRCTARGRLLRRGRGHFQCSMVVAHQLRATPTRPVPVSVQRVSILLCK